MKQFRCIGSACEDSCCVGWNVDIDESTYQKYRKLRDVELAPLLKKHVKRNKAAPSALQYAKIRLNEDLRCPFLDERSLCRIQRLKGEDFLSGVCAIYPRNVSQIDGVFERSATMSCPEAARLALLNPKGIEFIEDEESAVARTFALRKIDTGDFPGRPEKHLWNLRIFTINTLQNRNYRLWERLIMLGMFCKRIDDSPADEIPDIVQSFNDCINDGSFDAGLSEIPPNNTIQMQLLKEIVDTRIAMGISSTRYAECFNDFVAGIWPSGETSVEETGVRYREGYERYAAGFIAEHEYILENYLVNLAFRNIFPLFSGRLFDSYTLFVIHYALIKMHLIGMSIRHEGLTVELTLKLIQAFAKEVEHSAPYIEVISKAMRREKYDTMAYMAILIKN